MRTRALLLSGVIVAAIVVPVSSAAAIDDVDTSALRKAVTVNGILQHERVFQRIANNADGNRAAGTVGYTASVAYVKERLKRAGYRVSEQKFDFPFYQEVSPGTLSQNSPTATTYDVSTLTYSGSGEITGDLVSASNNVIPATPDPSSAAGCAPGDFAPASATAPQVALVQRGTCTFAQKVDNAVAAGYDAVVVFNEGNPGRTEVVAGTLGAVSTVPVLGLSYDDGVALYEATLAGATNVTLSTDTFSEIRSTSNVIADSKRGSSDRTIVVGAHLDSVLEGPGINDNGSGSATILETAIQMAKLEIQPYQKLRFAFWGAEELGLLGSTHYVDTLSDVNLSKIYANLNFDMLGSPNYVRFVYDGDGSDTPLAGPPGSAQIEQVFTDYFASQGLESASTEFSGRSDYGPFIAAGIPAGGLFSGAEGVKTEDEAAIFGGTAGEAYDACYHQACDDINNLSTAALSEMGDAVAHSVMTAARTRTGFFEDGSRMAVPPPISMDQFEYKGSHLVR